MPLLDHFHPPLNLRRHWHAFHHAWATYVASALNRLLPEGYFAEPNVQYAVEIDVATFEESNGALPTGDSRWVPPAPALTVPFTIAADIVEVKVFNTEEGPTLAGAIEIVSPANKDRPESRDAFVNKCAAYVQQGVGLVIVDVVTNYRANLHQALLFRLSVQDEATLETELYAVSYRPVLLGDQPNLEMWPHEVRLEDVLPTLPLWLRGEICLPVNLESTYQQTCQELRIQPSGPLKG